VWQEVDEETNEPPDDDRLLAELVRDLEQQVASLLEWAKELSY
jgi:hypothetical protein